MMWVFHSVDFAVTCRLIQFYALLPINRFGMLRENGKLKLQYIAHQTSCLLLYDEETHAPSSEDDEDKRVNLLSDAYPVSIWVNSNRSIHLCVSTAVVIHSVEV